MKGFPVLMLTNTLSDFRQVLCNGPPLDLDLRSFLTQGPPGITRMCRAGPYLHRHSPGCHHDRGAAVTFFRSRRWKRRGGAGNWRHRHEPWLNKDRYFPQCSKPIDHESILRTVFRLCGLSVSSDYLLWILKTQSLSSHRNTHKHINPSPKTNSSSSRSQCSSPPPPPPPPPLPSLPSQVAKVSERYVCLFPLQWRVNSARCNKKMDYPFIKGAASLLIELDK